MKLAFVTGLPNDISKELQQVPAIETLTMRDLLTRARMLTKDTAEDTVATMQFLRSAGGVSFETKPRTGITCYRCRGQVHMARDRATRRPDGTSPRRTHRDMRCFNCNKIGHLASECQGNDSGKDVNASLLPKQVKNKARPVIRRLVDGQQCPALVDTGCYKTHKHIGMSPVETSER